MEDVRSRNHLPLTGRRLPLKNNSLCAILLLITDAVVVVTSRRDGNLLLHSRVAGTFPTIDLQCILDTEHTARIIATNTELPVTNLSEVQITLPLCEIVGGEIGRQTIPHSNNISREVDLSISLHNLQLQLGRSQVGVHAHLRIDNLRVGSTESRKRSRGDSHSDICRSSAVCSSGSDLVRSIVLSSRLTTDLTTILIKSHSSRKSRIHSPAVGTSRNHLRSVHLELGIHITSDQWVGNEGRSTSSHSCQRVIHHRLINTSVCRRVLQIQNSSFIHLQELHHEQVTTNSQMHSSGIGRTCSTATITIDDGFGQRVDVQEGGIIRGHHKVVGSLDHNVDVTIHVGGVVITETLIQTRPSITLSFIVRISKIEFCFNLTVLSRVLVIVVKSGSSALGGSSPVATNKTWSRHFSFSTDQKLHSCSNRSHAIRSSNGEHLIRHRSIREGSSDGTS